MRLLMYVKPKRVGSFIYTHKTKTELASQYTRQTRYFENIEIALKSMGLELPLLSLNHVSYVCKSVSKSIKFYQDVLGFVLIKRPSSFDFEGAWLFSNGVGIHLLEVDDGVPTKKGKINPKDNHISFQTTNMNLLLSKLEDMNIEYLTAIVSDSGITVDQVFFHDPDGYMIEICNCQNFPVLPLSAACSIIKKTNIPLIRSQTAPTLFGHKSSEVSACTAEAAASLMMENLALNMMNFSI